MEQDFLILIAEDDPNDFLLLQRALQFNHINNPVHHSPNGQDAIEYLHGEGKYADRTRYPIPGLVLTDLKMPCAGGFDILAWREEHLPSRAIPTIVISSSRLDTDVRRAYELGANAYMHKPMTLEGLTELMRTLVQFWNRCEKPRREQPIEHLELI
jgi:CheY-like chemotaxis protein